MEIRYGDLSACVYPGDMLIDIFRTMGNYRLDARNKMCGNSDDVTLIGVGDESSSGGVGLDIWVINH